MKRLVLPLIIIFSLILFAIITKTRPITTQPARPKPLPHAYYEFGHTSIVKTFQVGKTGGVINVSGTKTPADGVMVDFPAGILEKETTLSIGYNDGKIENVQIGKFSDHAIVLLTEGSLGFENGGVRITVPYDPSMKPDAINGYSINDQGLIRPIDVISWDKENHRVTFLTFEAPLMIIWEFGTL